MTVISSPDTARWNDYTEDSSAIARQFVAACTPLIRAVLATTDVFDPELFADQARATLATAGPHSSFPMDSTSSSPAVTRQLAEQADVVGRQIACWVEEEARLLDGRPVTTDTRSLVVRSRCDGHLWTQPVADLLTGPHSGPVAMQLFNEWLHQLVLLRDALLPFANWEEVPLKVGATGLRHIERSREGFLAEALMRQVRHESLVDYARQVLTGTGGPAGYGFETETGTVLPAVVGGSPRHAASHLLTWRPSSAARTIGTVTYVYENDDYYTAPRSPLEPAPPTSSGSAPISARLDIGAAGAGTATPRLVLTCGSSTASVDLGQALRGHRYVHRQDAAPTEGGRPPQGPTPRSVDPWTVLSAPGLAWTEQGHHVVRAQHLDDDVVLALLGKLYPENVVIGSDGNRMRGSQGKSGPALVVIEVAE